MTFHEESRWFLLLLPGAIALVWWRWLTQRRHASVRFSSLDWFIRRGTTLRSRARLAIPILRTMAVSLLIVCLARPQKGNEETRIHSEGVAVQTVVDVSGSMEALDFNIEGKQVNRLQAIRHVFREFLLGDKDELKGRPDDLVGLITFAAYADTKSPLTLDHAAVLEILDQTDTVMSINVQRDYWRRKRELEQLRRGGSAARQRELMQELSLIESEDGTAIGDALGLAVNNLKELERRRGVSEEKRIKSKIILLMTDGANNAGDLSPVQAAEMAAAFGFKVYCIGVGTSRRVLVPEFDPLSGSERLRQRQFPIDARTLGAVAEKTGGKYYHAEDTAALRGIYEEIDRLEKTATEEKRYRQFRELATESIRLGWVRLPSLLAIALMLLSFELVLTHTLLRKAP